ncbi:hypothetical protein HALDL1_06975 [Halobacterium sp. DL1]|jgi:hypothetical protein|nr:hypothetical protein HALDL1_06975 [Halobacterium sp. DL1]
MLLVRTVIVTLGVQYPTMLFHVRLTHSPENCWARDEQEGKAHDLLERVENPPDSVEARIRNAFVAPNEHTFYFVVESPTFEGLTALLGPPLLEDHEADVVPVTTLSGALDTLEIE